MQGVNPPRTTSVEARIESIYRSDSRRIFATLIRLLGDFELAEEAMQEAFVAAARQWREDGVPESPRAWLVSTARFKAIDRMRHNSRWSDIAAELRDQEDEPAGVVGPDHAARVVEDDLLRLIFTCCHPALARDAQIALTLREVCGLTTEEIARAFLVAVPTMAQRIVRAKHKIREAAIPFEVPDKTELPERLGAVLHVVYLVFNEGYAASGGNSLTRPRLCAEALRLGRLLLRLSPAPEVMGLLGLMLVHDARRAARSDEAGDLVLMEDQDRSLWDHEQIAEGAALVERSLRAGPAGAYALQAAIAALHAEAPSWEETDWPQIVGLYEVLVKVAPSPVVELNLAAAVAMRDGPRSGLDRVEAILDRGDLQGFFPAHATRAELLARLGRREAARTAWERALRLTDQEPQQRLVRRRLRELQS